jgi:hypothetical protein
VPFINPLTCSLTHQERERALKESGVCSGLIAGITDRPVPTKRRHIKKGDKGERGINKHLQYKPPSLQLY